MSWPHLRRLAESRGGELTAIGYGARARRLLTRLLEEYSGDDYEALVDFEPSQGDLRGLFAVTLRRRAVTST